MHSSDFPCPLADPLWQYFLRQPTPLLSPWSFSGPRPVASLCWSLIAFLGYESRWISLLNEPIWSRKTMLSPDHIRPAGQSCGARTTLYRRKHASAQPLPSRLPSKHPPHTYRALPAPLWKPLSPDLTVGMRGPLGAQLSKGFL